MLGGHSSDMANDDLLATIHALGKLDLAKEAKTGGGRATEVSKMMQKGKKNAPKKSAGGKKGMKIEVIGDDDNDNDEDEEEDDGQKPWPDLDDAEVNHAILYTYVYLYLFCRGNRGILKVMMIMKVILIRAVYLTD
jgi:hypothetical protein